MIKKIANPIAYAPYDSALNQRASTRLTAKLVTANKPRSTNVQNPRSAIRRHLPPRNNAIAREGTDISLMRLLRLFDGDADPMPF
jgi:hypothetical protein